jgi:outer membrane immunogenic protein
MKPTLFGPAAVMAVLLAGPAFAADLYGRPPPRGDLPAKAPPVMAGPPPFYNWTGVYLGGSIGYGYGTTRHSFSNGAPGGTSDLDGAVAGSFIGAQYQVGRWVLGVEGDFESTDISGSYNDFSGITSQGAARIDWAASVRGRLGYAFDNVLIYATGGVAFAQFQFAGGPAGGDVSSFSRDLTGWTVGGGIEYAFQPNTIARLEYRYADYGDTTGSLAPLNPGVLMTTSNTTNVVRVGLAFQFGANSDYGGYADNSSYADYGHRSGYGHRGGYGRHAGGPIY